MDKGRDHFSSPLWHRSTDVEDFFGMDSADDSHSFVLNLYAKVSCEVDK